MGLRSHHSKHTKKNRERSKNRVEFNSVRSGLVHGIAHTEAGAVTSCGLFDLQRSLYETDAIVTEQACSEVRNLVRMRRESELLASCRIQVRRLRKRSP